MVQYGLHGFGQINASLEEYERAMRSEIFKHGPIACSVATPDGALPLVHALLLITAGLLPSTLKLLCGSRLHVRLPQRHLARQQLHRGRH